MNFESPLTSPFSPLANQEEPLYQQVFLSHTGKDEAARVFTNSILKPSLEAAGLSVFVDWLNIEPGRMLAAQMEDAARNSGVFIAVLSSSYVRRFWCMHELDLALHGRMTSTQRPVLVPVFFDPPEEVVAAAACWESNVLPQERQAVADARRWEKNVVQLANHKHFSRSSYISAHSYKGTDEAALAKDVAATVVRLVLPQAAVGPAVGLEAQAEVLLQVLQQGDKLGLWLHGCGELWRCLLAAAWQPLEQL